MSDPDTNGAAKPVLSGVALVVAVVALIAFGAFVWFMITERGAEETPWTRLAWLFASVEAVAFGAAGALFGSSIQRQQTEREKERADDNEKAAKDGRALATALVADDPADATALPGLESLDRPARTAAEGVAAHHATLARKFFPDA